MPAKSYGVLGPTPPKGFLGSYQVALTGVTATAPAAGATSVSLRWGSAAALLHLRRASLQLFTNAATTNPPVMGLYVARSFTASDSGGTAVVFTTNFQKRRTDFQASLVTDMRFADGASLTAGTRTPDAQPFTAVVSPTGQTTALAPTGLVWDGREEPVVLRQNEGILLAAAVGFGAGSARWVLALEWMEVAIP